MQIILTIVVVTLVIIAVSMLTTKEDKTVKEISITQTELKEIYKRNGVDI